jgi:hypothetical protein
MSEELDTKTLTVTGSFDQSWYIDHIPINSIAAHRPEIGSDRRKVIFGDLCFGIGYHIDDAGFTDTRSTDESNI